MDTLNQKADTASLQKLVYSLHPPYVGDHYVDVYHLLCNVVRQVAGMQLRYDHHENDPSPVIQVAQHVAKYVHELQLKIGHCGQTCAQTYEQT